MTTLINFEVGKKYKNRKGTYEVLSIDGNAMQISWKKGKEVISTTVTLQSRIIENIQRETSEELSHLIKSGVSGKYKASKAVSIC